MTYLLLWCKVGSLQGVTLEVVIEHARRLVLLHHFAPALLTSYQAKRLSSTLTSILARIVEENLLKKIYFIEFAEEF